MPADDEGVVDAARRTHLASERTELAWRRTGLTALAVALAVGPRWAMRRTAGIALGLATAVLVAVD